jgi:hypothetical protein
LAAKLKIVKNAKRLAAQEKQDAKKAVDGLAAAEGGWLGSKPKKRKTQTIN